MFSVKTFSVFYIFSLFFLKDGVYAYVCGRGRGGGVGVFRRGTYTCLFMSMWKPEAKVRCLPLSISTLFFKTELGTDLLTGPASQQAPDSHCLYLPSCRLNIPYHHGVAFLTGLESIMQNRLASNLLRSTCLPVLGVKGCTTIPG